MRRFARFRTKFPRQSYGLRVDLPASSLSSCCFDRAGESFGYTEAEYQAVLARHGGKTMMAVHAEVLKAPDAASPDEVRLTMVRKPPGNAELPS